MSEKVATAMKVNIISIQLTYVNFCNSNTTNTNTHQTEDEIETHSSEIKIENVITD